jgi:hypothetical protein
VGEGGQGRGGRGTVAGAVSLCGSRGDGATGAVAVDAPICERWMKKLAGMLAGNATGVCNDPAYTLYRALLVEEYAAHGGTILVCAANQRSDSSMRTSDAHGPAKNPNSARGWWADPIADAHDQRWLRLKSAMPTSIPQAARATTSACLRSGLL